MTTLNQIIENHVGEIVECAVGFATNIADYNGYLGDYYGTEKYSPDQANRYHKRAEEYAEKAIALAKHYGFDPKKVCRNCYEFIGE